MIIGIKHRNLLHDNDFLFFLFLNYSWIEKQYCFIISDLSKLWFLIHYKITPGLVFPKCIPVRVCCFDLKEWFFVCSFFFVFLLILLPPQAMWITLHAAVYKLHCMLLELPSTWWRQNCKFTVLRLLCNLEWSFV